MSPLILGSLFEMGGKVFDRIFPDPAQADAAKLEMFKLQQSGELQEVMGQLEINKVEAASSSTFVASWRPFIGWVCGAGCAWNWILLPVAKFAFAAAGHPIDIGPADMEEMLPILLGMLGLGTLRSYERVKGVIPKGR